MMSDIKLTVDQLKNYLGTGLKFHYQGEYDSYNKKPFEFEMTSISQHGWIDASVDQNGVLAPVENQYHIDDMFPLMYPLSDLDKFIPELGFVPLHKLLEAYCFDLTKMDNEEILSYKESMTEVDMSFMVAELLFQWHFWIFDQEYFEVGLIIGKLN